MKRKLIQLGALTVALLLTACGKTVNSPQGFRLPGGDVEAGRVAFAKAGCTQCHTVAGDALTALTKKRKMDIKLGGNVTEVETYAELVTSIIYPQHAISASGAETYKDDQGRTLMPDLSEKMTVRELVDITTYLQSHYNVVVPSYPDYPFAGNYYP